MTLGANRLCLIVAFVLLLIAALAAFGVLRELPVAGFALLGFAFWAVSGAV